MYNHFKLNDNTLKLSEETPQTIEEYANNCILLLIKYINEHNKKSPFPLSSTSMILFAGSEKLSIELAKVLSKYRNNLRVRNILLDNPAKAYEQKPSKKIEELIESDSSIKELTYELLTQSSTYEQDIIITGNTYAGVQYSDYNTHTHNLLVQCKDPFENKSDFLYSFTDFYRAPDSFCNESMYTVLRIE